MCTILCMNAYIHTQHAHTYTQPLLEPREGGGTSTIYWGGGGGVLNKNSAVKTYPNSADKPP